MSGDDASLTDWLATPPGRYLLEWETRQFDQAVSDIFGYHAVQLGFGQLDALGNNRMPHRWLAIDTVTPLTSASAAFARAPAFVADPTALPFAQNSLDLLAMPHTLEMSADPHAALREAERVLVPEGRVVMTGLNPNSLWGFRQSRSQWLGRLRASDAQSLPFLPGAHEMIGYWRLRDWLRLLNFEVESARFGAYVPSFESQKWLDRFSWMDAMGQRWWPIFGAMYCVVAVKRVRGMRLLEPNWKSRKVVAAAPAAVASKGGPAR
jgi:SAM-dependent methyltransferase